MKTTFLAIALGLLSTTLFANEIPYQCIADRMQAINSDIYYNLSPSDIDAFLQYTEFNYGHDDALNSLEACEKDSKEAKFLTCIADKLQAYNSDIYYGLSNEEVSKMLSNTNEFGHFDAVRMSQYCK